ncbi:MAG: ATP-binding protein [Planctomycetota bacterium]|nr:ATP-binding protein [Planctomycetota bacterium]
MRIFISGLFWSIFVGVLSVFCLGMLVMLPAFRPSADPADLPDPDKWWVPFAWLMLSAFVTAFFAARSLRGRLRAPLRSLTQAANSLAEGNYDEQVSPHSAQEAAPLVRAFNSMADKLKERIEVLSREENKVRTILAGMVEGVVAVDSYAKILHMNKAACEILNVSVDDPEGWYIYDVIEVEEVGELLRQTLRDGVERVEELKILKDGQEQVLEAHASPLRGRDGELAGGLVVLDDLTQLQRLERVRTDFVANVSNELKTPVTAISGLVETLIESEEMDEETRSRFLGKIQNQSLRLSSLVADLLALSRVEARDEQQLELRRMDLKLTAMDSVRRAMVAAEEKGIQLHSQLPEDAVNVNGDEEALRQVVDNLLDNAIKYTQGGGGVSLSIEVEDDSAILLVKDSGIGIEAEHQERIFERFYRVDKARSREVGGTGLGLSIVKHFTASMGGSVGVESEPGVGTAFRVELPLADEEEVEAPDLPVDS